MIVCDFCIHDDQPSSEFPCSECKHMDNGDGDMFVSANGSIKDSGNRTMFETGAVRDIQEGKGRCDLMPLGVIGDFMSDFVLNSIEEFKESGDPMFLHKALREFLAYTGIDEATMFLEVAKHFAEGAKKYKPDNWKLGIPLQRYVDSCTRHYFKHVRGDKDEQHDRAFVWNIICGIWTCEHKPELNDYAKENNNA